MTIRAIDSKRVFLIGMRGVGKSTVGPRLAVRLSLPFFDADAELEQTTGRTIRDIFETEGEPAFRQYESQTLERLSSQAESVIATGGGVVLNPSNRALMRSRGRVVWLHARVATMWDRMRADASSHARRPNLGEGGVEEIRQVLLQREPLYRECADLDLNTDDRSPDDIVDAILATC